MPHLSPMNWLLAIMSIWLFLTILLSMMWWQPKQTWSGHTSIKPKQTFIWIW